tara:strand:+ start:2049 stop:2948 length:900 start_codon:yes stop_codon:yes gene_type:complete
LRELALFAGAGGGILGGRLLGWRTVCAVESNAYAASVLLARQNDGTFPPFPIWDDVLTFDGRPWRGLVEVISGGFPCQDISVAGRGEGIDGEKSGLWSEFARIIREVRPRFVFVENSPALTYRGLGIVLGDLASMGFDAEWCVLGAHNVQAPHKRDRIWILARDADSKGKSNESEYAKESRLRRVDPDVADTQCVQLRNESRRRRRSSRKGSPKSTDNGVEEPMADTDRAQRERRQLPSGTRAEHTDACSPGWWATEPDVGRVAHGVAARVHRLTAIGNGQVPAVAELAWRILMDRISE